MNKYLKALLVIVLFAVCFANIMLVAYDYLYEFPIGILDTEEREDGYLQYKLVYDTKIDSNTTLYFTRSNNGVGTDCHFGTIDTKAPRLLANFMGKSTSSYYFSANQAFYTKANSSDKTCYLFGVITDENTVIVDVEFIINENDTKLYETNYEDHCFYYADFDDSYSQYPYTITGYNSDGYATFIYSFDSMDSVTTVSTNQ